MFDDATFLPNMSCLVTVSLVEDVLEWPYLLLPGVEEAITLSEMMLAAPHEMEGPLPDEYVRRLNAEED